jgi:hypothetical protein
MSFLLFRQFESMYSFDMIVNGILVLLIIYYPNVCSVYEIMGECPLLGSPFLV